jgi:hypothetical protein
LGADEVQHGAVRRALGLAQPPAELLQEERGALGRAEHHYGVDHGNVDTLVEQVDGEHDLDLPGGKIAQGGLALGSGAVAPDRDRLDAVMVEVSFHEPGVLDAHAEPQAAHRLDIRVIAHLLHHETSPSWMPK